MATGSGKFIVFEGIEGSGKSTQARILFRRLCRLAPETVLTREPGGTPLGGRVRLILKKSPRGAIDPLSELFLFLASRSQLVARVIQPALAGGAHVVCDRFADSSLAYQGYGRGLSLEMIDSLNKAAKGGLRPDLVVLLDMPAGDGLKRKGEAGYDRFESEEVAFHQKVREGYLDLAGRAGGRWLVVDASRPRSEIAEIIWDRVQSLVGI